MKENLKDHPSILLGQFLKDKRIGAGLTLRQAIHVVGIEVSKLSELERGIGDHGSAPILERMAQIYGLDAKASETLADLVIARKGTKNLNIADIYTKSELLPAFHRFTPQQEAQFLKKLGYVEKVDKLKEMDF